MTAAFLDTSYLIALLRRKDGFHQRGVAWQRVLQGRLITTEFVLVEFLDAMSVVTLRLAAWETAAALQNSPSIEIVPATRELLSEAQQWYARHADKEWGLTDGASFCAMRARGVTRALTVDRHFEQAGFEAVPLRDPSSR